MRVISVDPGTKNLGLCVVDFPGDEDSPARICEWVVTALDGSDAAGVASTMARVFGETGDLSKTEVVIEKQVSGSAVGGRQRRSRSAKLNCPFFCVSQPPKNAKTRTLQNFMEMLWTLRGADRVYVQDARLKLNWAATTRHWPRREIPDWSYAVRKKLSVEVARSWLDDGDTNAPWKEMFEASKKKDDLADALLQALAYTNMARRVLASETNKTSKKAGKAIVARKPSDTALESGRFTRNGAKWMLIQALGVRDGDAATLEEVLGKRGADVTRLRKSILKLFGSYDACARECFGR